MSLRTFIFGLALSFGIAWISIIIIPFSKMRNLAPIKLDEAMDSSSEVFYPKRSGRVSTGAKVYAENGCYLCHTQLVRPTYAGNDLFRSDWGGLAVDPDRGDTRRETNAYDFIGEKFAQIGVSRMGPDLSNLGHRVELIYAVGIDPSQWLFDHLYNPRFDPYRWKSTCPSYRFLFDSIEDKGRSTQISQQNATANVTPNSDAKALVSYLLSLKKDQKVPPSLDFSPVKNKS